MKMEELFEGVCRRLLVEAVPEEVLVLARGCVEVCDVLNDLPVLSRAHTVKQAITLVNSYSAREQLDGGKGTRRQPMYPEPLKDYFYDELLEKTAVRHMVWAYLNPSNDFMGPMAFSRTNSVVVPVGVTGTWWNPKVRDSAADVGSMMMTKDSENRYSKQYGEPVTEEQKVIVDEMVAGYRNEWPKGRVEEVIVDCPSYYLVNLEKLSMYGDVKSLRGSRGAGSLTYAGLSSYLRKMFDIG